MVVRLHHGIGKVQSGDIHTVAAIPGDKDISPKKNESGDYIKCKFDLCPCPYSKLRHMSKG